MKYLFIKDGCVDCAWVKENTKLNGTKLLKLDDEDAEPLGMLAYFGAVELARKKLPLLAIEETHELITGKLNIKMNIEKGM